MPLNNNIMQTRFGKSQYFSHLSLSAVEKGCVESGFTGASDFIISANFFIDSGVLSSIFVFPAS